jgi:DNA helicase HerA-like ATPase
MESPAQPIVGRVIGTEPAATPLEFWVAVAAGQTLALDDVVALRRPLPDGSEVAIYGVVTGMRARHEGARFDSDVFLVEDGILPAQVAEAAQVLATRFEPERFVPPLPGLPVYRATGADRDMALSFDRMEHRLPVGLSRDGEPVYVNLEFLDGTRGAHVNISGISGVATKTSYATFLLYSLFDSGVLGAAAANTKALIFNVKGEDLLFLDRRNLRLDATAAARYARLGLVPGAFRSVEIWAPPRAGSAAAVPDVASRHDGVGAFVWTLGEFCDQDLLPFLFADAEDDRQHYTIAIHNAMAQLRKAKPLAGGGVILDGVALRTFGELVDLIEDRVLADATQDLWAGRALGLGTINAFLRRLHGARRHVGRLIRGDIGEPEAHRIRHQAQVTVVDIHNLHDRAKRFVVGVVLRRRLEEKEASGQARPSLYVVLDELNKYAPREGSSPIKELLLDIAERGRSLGVILIGAEQTASEVERRVLANAALRVVGRLDSGEAGAADYGWLPPVLRQRATIARPGTMFLGQPELPIPLVVEFPFPSWATRASEAAPATPSAESAAPPGTIGDLWSELGRT